MTLPASPGPNIPLCAICGKPATGIHMRPTPLGSTFFKLAGGGVGGGVPYCNEHRTEAFARSLRPLSDEKPKS